MSKLLLNWDFLTKVLNDSRTVYFSFIFLWQQFDKDIIDEAFAIAKLGIVINSSTNFLLYCISGRRFRKEFYIVIGLAARERGMSSYADSRSTGASGTSTTGI